jgi:pimeloyl-ACP methyl ester carboxylesterase
VAAPEFPLTDPDIAGPHLDESDINQQPGDVRFVTDQLVAPTSPVAARIDPDRVGVAGHSDGAETALAASATPAPAGEPRYRAVVVLSGQAVPGTAGHNPPMLVIQGDSDDINPPSLGLGAYQQAASPKYLVIMRGAGHLPPYEAGSQWLGAIESVTEAFLDSYVARDRPTGAIATSVGLYGGLSLQSG